MKVQEACQILARRLAEEYGIERTPMSICEFLMARIVAFKPTTAGFDRDDIAADLILVLRGLIEPDAGRERRFEIFAGDIGGL